MEKLKDKIEKYINKTGVIRTPAYFIKDLFSQIVDKLNIISDKHISDTKDINDNIKNINDDIKDIITLKNLEEFRINFIEVEKYGMVDQNIPLFDTGDTDYDNTLIENVNNLFIDNKKSAVDIIPEKKDKKYTIKMENASKASREQSNILRYGKIISIHQPILDGVDSEFMSYLYAINCDNLYIHDLEQWCQINNAHRGVGKIKNVYINGCYTTKLEIPKHITRIEAGAFIGMPFEEIVLHDGISYIGDAAFANCLNLKKIKFPKKVEYFGLGMLGECPNLEELILPDEGVTALGTFTNSGSYYRGMGGSKIKYIKIPKGVRRIYNFFSNNLETIEFDCIESLSDFDIDYYRENLTFINVIVNELNYDAPINLNIHKINTLYIKNLNINTISGNSFFKSSDHIIKHLKIDNIISNNIKYQNGFLIENNVIKYIDFDVINAIVPQNVIGIDFNIKHAIENLELNNTLIIDNTDLSNIKSISILEDNPNYTKIDKFIVKNNDTIVWCEKDITDFVIPEQIINIYDYAFANCKSLIDVNLKNISCSSNVFNGCENIKSVIGIDGGGVKDHIFYNCPLLETYYMSYKVNNSVNFFATHKNVKNIYYYTNNEYVLLSGWGSTNGIYKYSWFYPTEENIILYQNYMNSTNPSIFSYCYNLKSITVSWGTNNYVSGADNIFSGINKHIISPNFESFIFEESEFHLKYGNYIEENGIIYTKDKTKIIAVPNNHQHTGNIDWTAIKEIGDYAFYKYHGNGLSISSDITIERIGSWAFSYATINAFNFDAKIKYIDSYAFSNCGISQMSLDLSNRGITHIGSYAFYYDGETELGGLFKFHDDNTVEYIGREAFANYPNYAYKFNNIKEIEDYAFRNTGSSSHRPVIEINCANLDYIGNKVFEGVKSTISNKPRIIFYNIKSNGHSLAISLQGFNGEILVGENTKLNYTFFPSAVDKEYDILYK